MYELAKHTVGNGRSGREIKWQGKRKVDQLTDWLQE